MKPLRLLTVRTSMVPLILAILLALTIVACSPGFKPAVLKPEEIPATIKDQIELMPGDGELVFRAYYEQDGYQLVAYTYTIARVGQPAFSVTAFTFDAEEGVAEPLGSAGGGMFGNRYGWNDSGVSTEDARWEYVAGWAYSADAHRVVATTSRGRTVEAAVVDGFWLLWLEVEASGLERFLTVTVYDSKGAVLHTGGK